MENLKITIAAIVLAFFVCSLAKAQTDKKVFTLEQNKSVEQELAAGQTHSYEIKIDKEQFLHAVIDQKSADVVVALFSPDNRKVLEVNNPNINRGPEQIFFITTIAGTHRVEISAKESGRYEAKIESLRAATTQDRNRVEAERAFIEGERFSVSAAHAQAVAKYEEAFQLINNSGDRYGEATILYSLGKAHNALGDKEKSFDYFRRSLALFQTAGSWDELFKDLSPLYAFMGGKQQTFDYLAGALPLVRALRNQRLEAILLTGLTKVCEDMNQQQQALDYKQQALALFRITGKRDSEVFTLTEIADGDLSLEDKKKAVGYLNQVVLLSRGASDKGLEVTSLMGIGYIYASIDEHQKALSYFRQTLTLWRELKDKNGEAYALNFIGSIYFLLGDYFSARDYFEQSLALFREVGDKRAEAQTIAYLGYFESRFGDAQKAFDYYQKALKVFREKGAERSEANIFSLLAETYWRQGDKQKALEHYQKSLSIWRKTEFREGEAIVLTNLGFVYESLGETERALDSYNQALPIFRLLGNQSGEASSLYGIARAHYTRGNLDEALAKIETAINLIESLRTKIATAELRASFLASYQHLYQFYVDLLMQLNKSRPSQGFDALALQASERARARSLLDILNEAQTDFRQGVDPMLLERERALQKQLNAKGKERTRAQTALANEALDKEIRALTTAYQELQAEIKLKSPHYAALTQPKPADLKEIQAMLDADTLLLEYWLGSERSYLWIVSPNGLKTFQLPKRADIEAKARVFYDSIKDSLKNPAAEAQVPKAAFDLSKILIEPAAAELGNKRLLIVADGVLQYVPFAALRSPKSDEKNEGQRTKDKGQFLIETNEIISLPSASALAVLREESARRSPAPKTIAVLADPVFDPTDPRVVRGAANKRDEVNQIAANSPLQKATRDAGFKNNSLERLLASGKEAKAVLSLVPKSEIKLALDFEASRATATSPELGEYRIIHFATHGLLNSQHPELSGIVLSLVDENGKRQDGFLRLHEIYNLKLPADLVVLSACQTALGKEIKGEGLIGLTRGFMYAGAQRVAASLWEVEDDATARLMRNFYQKMLGEKKLRPAAALREAQIAMLKNQFYAAPYYWAAFIIQGEWR